MTDDLTPPADTRICNVEDWVSSKEIDSHTFAEDCPSASHAIGGFADCELHLERLAKRRHGIHRAGWLEQHDVPQREQFTVWPVGWPRWLDDSGTAVEIALPRRQIRRYEGAEPAPVMSDRDIPAVRWPG